MFAINKSATNEWRTGFAWFEDLLSKALYWCCRNDRCSIAVRPVRPLAVCLLVLAAPQAMSAYVLEHTLVPADGEDGDLFGYSVSTSQEYSVIGAWRHDGVGAAYIYDNTTGSQVVKIDSPDLHGVFGNSVDIGTDALAVGSYSQRSVRVYEADTGEERFALNPQGGNANDHFGEVVAISQSYIAVGASRVDSDKESSGAVFVFDLQTGEQLYKVEPEITEQYGQFGENIDLTDQYLAVGVDNSDGGDGKVFVYDARSGSLELELVSENPGEADNLGSSVSIVNDSLLVGAKWTRDRFNSGVAYRYDLVTGNKDGMVKAAPTDRVHLFGENVKMTDEYVFVSTSVSGRGGVVYQYDAISLDFIDRFFMPASIDGSGFGGAIDANGDYFAVGASPISVEGDQVGAAFLYQFEPDDDGGSSGSESGAQPLVSVSSMSAMLLMLPPLMQLVRRYSV